jgi:hypothetical protein
MSKEAKGESFRNIMEETVNILKKTMSCNHEINIIVYSVKQR